MSNKRIVLPVVQYVLTEDGRAALVDSEICGCWPVVDGGWLVCRSCGTIWGTLSQSNSMLAAIHRMDEKR